MNDRDDILEFIKIEFERIKTVKELRESSEKGVSKIFLEYSGDIIKPMVTKNQPLYISEHCLTSGSILDPEYSKDLCLNKAKKLSCESMVFEQIIENDSEPKFVTNIPLRSLFFDKIVRDSQSFDAICRLKGIEEQISAESQRDISICINKRLSQVSTSKKHLDKIYNDLKKYSGTYFFLKAFVNRILDQGRIQVTKHPKSYIAYSYMLCAFYSEEMMHFFRFNLFTLKSESLSGAYLIYFGLLKLKQKVKEAYAFIIAVIEPYKDDASAEIIENFLLVLGFLIKDKLPNQFIELCRAIEHKIIFRIENKGCAERIKCIIKDLANKKSMQS